MFRVGLKWSPQASVPGLVRDKLPSHLEVHALPPEGTAIHVRGDDETSYTLFTVEVEFIDLEAEDPVNTEYVIYVIHE